MQSTTHLMAHSDAGLGEPAVLFLPGWCGGREVFALLLERTAEVRRSVSVDWRGHGESPATEADFGAADLVADTLTLVGELGLDRVVPVALAHAGWIAIELRRALGPDRVPAVVLLDWMPLGPPPGFLGALAGLQEPGGCPDVRAQLFAMWGAGVDDPAVLRYIASMGTYDVGMWGRAGREIAAAFTAQPTPLAALEAFAAAGAPCPTLHLYAQPRDDAYLAAQQAFAAEHDWFTVGRLDGRSHFPCLEVPDQVAAALDGFLAGR